MYFQQATLKIKALSEQVLLYMYIHPTMSNNKRNMARETLRVKKLVNRNPHEISGEEIQTSLCLQLYTNSNPSFKHIAHLVKSVIEVGLDSFTQFTEGIFVLSKTRNYRSIFHEQNFTKKNYLNILKNKIYYPTFLLSKSCQYFPKDPNLGP